MAMNVPMSKVSKNILNSFNSILKDRDSIALDEFVNWALYDPLIGYYQSSRRRVGKHIENDFYTSTSLGSTWGKLIVEASTKLLGKRMPDEFVFVEIGAEPETGVLTGLEHPFAAYHTIRLGDPFDIPAQAIVYCNEWLDAQPFRSFKYNRQKSTWMEISVGLRDSDFIEVETLPLRPPGYSFPKEAPDGYRIDWPSGAISSLTKLLSTQSWSGVFLTFDYGLDIHTILHDRPEGTARAYAKQKMHHDLLKNPGFQDLTCHLCWNSLKDCLELSGFEEINLASQESFLINNSSNQIKKIFELNSQGLNPEMLALKELLHPAHLGHGMQALSAIRY